MLCFTSCVCIHFYSKAISYSCGKAKIGYRMCQLSSYRLSHNWYLTAPLRLFESQFEFSRISRLAQLIIQHTLGQALYLDFLYWIYRYIGRIVLLLLIKNYFKYMFYYSLPHFFKFSQRSNTIKKLYSISSRLITHDWEIGLILGLKKVIYPRSSTPLS